MERLWVELTERCNLACAHCFVRRELNDIAAQSQEMSSDFFCQILTDAAELGCKAVEFTGGEVLVRTDFDRIFAHACRLGLRVSVTTNLTLLRNKTLDLWEEYPPTSLKVSIYGWDADSYDTVVGKPGSFKRFRTSIQKLVDRGFQFKALVPAHPILIKDFSRLQAFAAELKAELPVFYGWELMLHVRRNSDASQCIRSLRLDPTEAARLRMQFLELVLNDIQLIRQGQKDSRPLDDRLFRCIAADKLLAVDAYGYLQPCRPIRHPQLGYDLKQGSLRQAVLDHLPRVREMRVRSETGQQKCGRCLLRPACSSCPATSWVESGSLDEPTQYYCDVIHQEAYWLGLLPNGAKGWEANDLIINTGA